MGQIIFQFGIISIISLSTGNNTISLGNATIYSAIQTSSNTAIGAGSYLSNAGSSSTVGFTDLGYQADIKKKCITDGGRRTIITSISKFVFSGAFLCSYPR